MNRISYYKLTKKRKKKPHNPPSSLLLRLLGAEESFPHGQL